MEQQEWCNKVTDEAGKKRGVSIEGSKFGTKDMKSRRPITAELKYNIEHKMVAFYKIWQKHNEIQLKKDKMDFNKLKMKYHPPFPVWTSVNKNQNGREQLWEKKSSTLNNNKHNMLVLYMRWKMIIPKIIIDD